jgi:integrase
LEFLILTAARSGEVLGATWPEIDFDARLWIIPAERMKAGREHRVPLTEAALKTLRPLYDARISEFIFPGYVKGRPLSGMAFAMLFRRMKMTEITAHGFRSAFRDWAGDKTSFPRDIAEQALAHRVGDATELAYRRGDALEKRRKLMEAWTAFCTLPTGANVVRLRR